MSSAVLSTPRFDVYRAITEKIVGAIESGVGEHQMPWHQAGPALGRPTNVLTKNPYRGVNVLALWAEAMLRGYDTGHWATYRQWRELGAQVRKGERGAVIVFYKKTEQESENDTNEEPEKKQRLIARASWVFNAAQVEGWRSPEPEYRNEVTVLANVESFVAATRADIRCGYTLACYHVRDDFIRMPGREQFIGTRTSSPTESYYAVLFHELTHWTGHSTRLARDLKNRFGSDAYAMEELVAELGAAFLCADLSIGNEPRDDHASYLSWWLRVLKSDPRALFTTASKASAAAEFLLKMGNTPEPLGMAKVP